MNLIDFTIRLNKLREEELRNERNQYNTNVLAKYKLPHGERRSQPRYDTAGRTGIPVPIGAGTNSEGGTGAKQSGESDNVVLITSDRGSRTDK